MAGDAGVHGERPKEFFRRLGACLHGPVTLGALKASQGYVPPVGEIHVGRDARQLVPGELPAGGRDGSELFLFGIFGQRHFMAEHARLQSRQGGPGLVAGSHVAIRAHHPHLHVLGVVEGDGLGVRRVRVPRGI